MTAPAIDMPISSSTYGLHGSCSQYSTSRGAPRVSTLANTSRGRVLTWASRTTTGTGTTSAKPAGGPW
jgi:hypothetical protein